jgi:hypothetical protein
VDGTTYQGTVILAPSTAPLGKVSSPHLENPEQVVDFQMTVADVSDAGVSLDGE